MKYFEHDSDMLVGRSDEYRPRPNYTKSQIEERLLQAGTKQIPAKHLIRYTIILSIKKNLEIAEKEYA